MLRFHLLLTILIATGGGLDAATAIASATFSGGDQGRIVVEAKINGKGPYPFVFDTGRSTSFRSIWPINLAFR